MNRDEESATDAGVDDLLMNDTEAILSREISQLSDPPHDDVRSLNPDHFDDDDDDNVSIDDDDVSIDEEAVQDDIAIAERTNQLMTDFRSYINDIQGGTSAVGDNGDGDTAIGNNNGDVDSAGLEYGEYDKPHTNDSLMRGWDNSNNSDGSTTKQRRQPYRDDEASSSYYNDIAQTSGYDLSTHSRSRPRTVYAHSKKMKKCLICTIAACVSIGIIAGISKSVHNKRVQSSLPDWEGELALELQEEEEKNQWNNGNDGNSDGGGEGIPQHTEQINHNPQVGEGLQTPPSSSTSDGAYYAGDQGLDESGGMSPEDMLQQPPQSSSSSESTTDTSTGTGITFVQDADMEHPAYRDTTSTYAPKWFNRQSGWSGESYDQGLIFCGEQKDGDGESMVRSFVCVYIVLMTIENVGYCENRCVCFGFFTDRFLYCLASSGAMSLHRLLSPGTHRRTLRRHHRQRRRMVARPRRS